MSEVGNWKVRAVCSIMAYESARCVVYWVFAIAFESATVRVKSKFARHRVLAWKTVWRPVAAYLALWSGGREIDVVKTGRGRLHVV